jgi:hypothetical protein
VSFQVPYSSCIMYKSSSTSTSVVVSSTKVPSIFETLFSADILYNHILYQTNYVIRIIDPKQTKANFVLKVTLFVAQAAFSFH